jgi:uncharacterized RDD family membrane protein YckC
MTEHERMTGVIYAREDCLGVARRLLIDVVDVAAASLLSIVLTVIASIVMTPDGLWQLVTLLMWTFVWLGYFVFLKGSRYRTLGYVLGKAKILNLQGEPPSLGQLLLRFLFSVFGPLNLLLDLLWIPSDPFRQALRDKFAGTYVVKKGAVATAQGNIVFVPYTMFGQSYIFKEVKELADADEINLLSTFDRALPGANPRSPV